VALSPQLTRTDEEATASGSATIAAMADESAQPLNDQLEEIGAQLAWVRDYL
jgi:hypothetical protein